MGDNSTLQFSPLPDRHPSVHKLWQQARAEGGNIGEIERRYRELLEEFGHRNEGTGKW